MGCRGREGSLLEKGRIVLFGEFLVYSEQVEIKCILLGINMNSLVDCFCGVFLGNSFDSHSALKFKITALAFIRGTDVYLRSSVYSKLNLHATDSHPILVIATKKGSRPTQQYFSSVGLNLTTES